MSGKTEIKPCPICGNKPFGPPPPAAPLHAMSGRQKMKALRGAAREALVEWFRIAPFSEIEDLIGVVVRDEVKRCIASRERPWPNRVSLTKMIEQSTERHIEAMLNDRLKDVVKSIDVRVSSPFFDVENAANTTEDPRLMCKGCGRWFDPGESTEHACRGPGNKTEDDG